MPTQQPSKRDRTTQEILRDIDAATARLAGNVAGLVAEVHPKAVVNRTVVDAKHFAAEQYEYAKTQVKDEYGWRVDRLAVAAGAAAGLLTFLLVVRSVNKRRRH
ncbi:MAG: DUF3618 domain-containing protein [Actinomycetia bacterium]|nr:DUF3618 domain-containing protein [Actinomycetes bacterium]